MGNPLPLNLAQECRKAEKILREFVDPAHGGLDRVIPISVLKKAQGLAIFTVARVGFLMSARAGSGVVIARLSDDSWSAPSALGLGGVGAGFNAGLDVTDFVIVLNSKQAVRTFMATGSLQLGGNLSVAVGPLGRAAEASGAVNSSGNLAAIFSYSKSKGLYGGVSIEGTVLVDRSDANSKTYHRNVTAKQILEGHVDRPSFADPLIALIEKFTLSGEVRAGMDGRSASARGYGYFGSQSDVDSLDRDFRDTRVGSPPLSPPGSNARGRDTDDFDEDYARARRSPEYAFGTNRGRSTNSPTSPKNNRSSYFGGSSSTARAPMTDYGNRHRTEDDNLFDSSSYSSGRKGSGANYDNAQGSFSKSGVQPRKDASAAPYVYGAEERRSLRTAANFPTKFDAAYSSDDDDNLDAKRNFPSTNRDPFAVEEDWRKVENKSQSAFSSRHDSASHTSSYRDRYDDDLGRELAAQARGQERRKENHERNLIDFDDDLDSHPARRTAPPPPPSSSFGRRKTSGMDSLDKELQQRSSISTDSDQEHYNDTGMSGEGAARVANSGWRSDYGLPDDQFAAPLPQSKRPPMHHRTSSAQKLWNRVRGNSQSSRAAAFAPESWESRYRTTDTPPLSNSGKGTPRPASGAGGRYRGTPSPKPTFANGLSSSSSLSSTTPPPTSLFAAAAAAGASIRRTGSSTPTALNADSIADDGAGFVASALNMTVELQVVAMFDFVGQEEHDLSFKRGDVIDILQKTESREDWWLGRTAGRVGNLPANFTKDL